MPQTEDSTRVALMFAFEVSVTLLSLLLRKWKFSWKRFVKRKDGTKKLGIEE